MLNPVTIGAAVIIGLLLLLLVIGLMGKQDTTTPEEIAVPLDEVPADSVSPAFTR